MHIPALLILVLSVLACCAKPDARTEIAAKQNDLLERAAEILQSVTDADSAERAAPQLEALFASVHDLRRDRSNLDPAGLDDMRPTAPSHQRLAELTERIGNVVIQLDDAGFAKFEDVLRRLRALADSR